MVKLIALNQSFNICLTSDLLTWFSIKLVKQKKMKVYLKGLLKKFILIPELSLPSDLQIISAKPCNNIVKMIANSSYNN